MGSSIGNITERITEYVQIKTEQIKLTVITCVSRVLADVIFLFFVSVAGLFFIFFLSFSLGSYLNTLFESDFSGHLLVAAFYFVLITIMILLMKTRRIQGWLEDFILNIVEKKDEQED